MAYLKEHNIRHKLKRTVDYASDKEKTDLELMFDYALNPDKTEKRCYASALRCTSVDTAYSDMMKTKKRFGKQDKVQGHHYIQSFKPGEVTPELCHKIGKEFAERCFGSDYEVVIGTHLNKNHLHNHIVLNSVAIEDGRKFQSTPINLREFRSISDEICLKYGLSVIQTKGKGKHYSEWKADKENKPTIRLQIKADIDETIAQSYNFDTFLELLQLKGYTLKYGDNVKHFAVKPPYSTKFIRLRSLGKGYSDSEIAERIEDTIFHIPNRAVRTFYYNGSTRNITPTKRYTGLQALYWRFLYEMGVIRKRKRWTKVTAYMRQEMLKFDKYVAERDFIASHNITTSGQLEDLLVSTIMQIDEITAKRAELYQERRGAYGESLAGIKREIGENTQHLRVLRKQKEMCERICIHIPALQERLQKIKEMEVNSNVRGSSGRYDYEDRS